jgi:hypothetical protein
MPAEKRPPRAELPPGKPAPPPAHPPPPCPVPLLEPDHEEDDERLLPSSRR